MLVRVCARCHLHGISSVIVLKLSSCTCNMAHVSPSQHIANRSKCTESLASDKPPGHPASVAPGSQSQRVGAKTKWERRSEAMSSEAEWKECFDLFDKERGSHLTRPNHIGFRSPPGKSKPGP